MHRELFISCLPFLGAILVSLGVLALIIRISGARLRLASLKHLHRDQVGGVQSLSFVLTLPLFIMVLMFIVQLSQITIAKVVVEYAAITTARSAVVWIPANVGTGSLIDGEYYAEEENRIGSSLVYAGTESENGKSYDIYVVQPGTPKFQKMHLAAAMACMSVCPSRDVGASKDEPLPSAVASMQKAYFSVSPASAANERVPARLENKLAYAIDNTRIRVEVRHKEDEPPLQTEYLAAPYPREFAPNEVGWQDQVVVTVQHDFALLPGPARLLARRPDASPGTSPEQSYAGGHEGDTIARNVRRHEGVYVYSLKSTARLNNEGEKPLLAYVQRWRGIPGYNPTPYTGDADLPGYGGGGSFREEFYDKDEDVYWRETDDDGTTTDDSGQEVGPPDGR